IYEAHTSFLRERFNELLEKGHLRRRVRATYPEIRVEMSSHAKIDSRLSYGHVAAPGGYSTTVTRPRLFRAYLADQIGLILRNHELTMEVGPSAEPIPLHFAFEDAMQHIEGAIADRIQRPLRDMFDVPDLAVIDDSIVNGTYLPPAG